MFYYPLPVYLIRDIGRGDIYRQMQHNKPSKNIENFLLFEFYFPIINLSLTPQYTILNAGSLSLLLKSLSTILLFHMISGMIGLREAIEKRCKKSNIPTIIEVILTYKAFKPMSRRKMANV